jgi:hypothetical protein
MGNMLPSQLVERPELPTDAGDFAALASLSGESEQRLRLFARIHENKAFSKQTAFDAFAGLVQQTVHQLERVKGIEPSYEAWEAAVLPLNYTR